MTHRQQVTANGREMNLAYYRTADNRKVKRIERLIFRQSAVEVAHYEGHFEASNPRGPRPNPYPPGRRHDAWQHAFDTADPLGDWHGGNY